MGVILAVAGSAVGLGNFLRFPGQVAEHGGGAYMITYFLALIFLGLPICWAEWAMGRRGGDLGYNSCPAILGAISRRRWVLWASVIGVIIPIVIYMYYVYIEAWCLGYAINFLCGTIDFQNVGESTAFWVRFIGADRDGGAIHFGLSAVGGYLVAVFVLNFWLIYRGLSKGIELFCRYAMPTLIAIGLIVLVRVLTLDPPAAAPQQTVLNGLGFMWNPEKAVMQTQVGDGRWVDVRRLLDRREIEMETARVKGSATERVQTISLGRQLLNPEIWLASAGQIFFSLSVGFGIILTYSSYLRKRDDVVLSGLSATGANEFCEVALGGLITVPAGYVFLGAAGLAGAGLGTFDLGFKVLPMVFTEMPYGHIFGFLFFFLLFLAAITSSISMLQPGIAFIEESLGVRRRQSVAILGFITFVGTFFIFYFSKDAKALDTLDFWVGTFLIYLLATLIIVTFGWVLGIREGWELAHQGASIRIPRPYRYIMKYVAPLYLLFVFAAWFLNKALGINLAGGEAPKISSYIKDLFIEPNVVSWISVGLIILVGIFSGFIIANSRLYHKIIPHSHPPQS